MLDDTFYAKILLHDVEQNGLHMNKKKRALLRNLSIMSVGVGFMLALAASGNADFRDELKDSDAETRARYEKEVMSEKKIKDMALTAIAMMSAGVIGLMCAEKKR